MDALVHTFTSASDLSHGIPAFGIFDLNKVIFPHWEGLDDQICACIIEVIDKALRAKGQSRDEGVIYDRVAVSYDKEGLGTLGPARDWGLNHAEIHRDYHHLSLMRHIIPNFEDKFSPYREFLRGLRSRLRRGVRMGMKFGVLSHGDDEWAETIPGLMGLHEFLPIRRGIDNFGGRLKDRHPCLWRDFLKAAKYRGAINSVFFADDMPRNLQLLPDLGIMPALISDKANISVPQGVHHSSTVLDCLDVALARRGAHLAHYERLRTARPQWQKAEEMAGLTASGH